MTSNLNHQVEDQMLLISQLYPGMYTQMVPKEGEGRRRRIRKKSKAEESGSRIVKRKLSTEQVNMLEMNFGNEHKLECERKDRLALELGLDPRQVAVWFQNRRARWKSKKLEEEYSKLKSVHESVVVEKCHLEAEVIKLKEQLSEADKEIQRLSERWDGNGSPSSCANPYFPQEFEMQGFENLCYIPDQTNYIHGMEWLNLYAL